jgi:Ca2+-binding EF-hand superfamily protein
MNPLYTNKTLSQIAREEVKKYIRNESSYNPYLTGNQMKGVVPSGFLEQNAALIADCGADEAETVVPKLLLNKTDKEKKGRKILCTPEYTQIGIASRESEGENYYVIILANDDCVEEGEPQLPEGDLTELKQAFDLYDHDGTQKIKIKECIDGMKSVDFDKTNPILFDIICDLEGNEWCSWPKFASHVYNCITDRNTDEGLRTLFDLFIDDPNKDTITFDTFKRICKEVGENMSDEEMKNILEITTQSGNDINFDDFCQYMKLTA